MVALVDPQPCSRVGCMASNLVHCLIARAIPVGGCLFHRQSAKPNCYGQSNGALSLWPLCSKLLRRRQALRAAPDRSWAAAVCVCVNYISCITVSLSTRVPSSAPTTPSAADRRAGMGAYCTIGSNTPRRPSRRLICADVSHSICSPRFPRLLGLSSGSELTSASVNLGMASARTQAQNDGKASVQAGTALRHFVHAIDLILAPCSQALDRIGATGKWRHGLLRWSMPLHHPHHPLHRVAVGAWHRAHQEGCARSASGVQSARSSQKDVAIQLRS